MNLPLRKERFICLDAEMTGLNPAEDRIIEVAAVRFSIEEGVIECFEQLINPKMAIPQESIAIHNITPNMLEDKPTIIEIFPSLMAFLKNDIIVGHQVSFDLTMLSAEAKRTMMPFDLSKFRTLDTLRLARNYGDSPNNSLIQLAKHFNVPFLDSHRAMSDVLMNIEVFRHLVSRYKTLDDLVKILAKPIKMKYMPLGKYKGRLFSDIPHPYLQWASNGDFDQDLLFSIRSELRKRKAAPGFSEASNPFKQL